MGQKETSYSNHPEYPYIIAANFVQATCISFRKSSYLNLKTNNSNRYVSDNRDFIFIYFLLLKDIFGKTSLLFCLLAKIRQRMRWIRFKCLCVCVFVRVTHPPPPPLPTSFLPHHFAEHMRPAPKSHMCSKTFINKSLNVRNPVA